MFPWCSGYHVRLTRARSPVRSRAETSFFFFFFFLLCLFLFFFHHPWHFFWPTFNIFDLIFLGFQRLLAILLYYFFQLVTVKKALPGRKHLQVLQLQHTYLPAFRFHHLITKKNKKQTKNCEFKYVPAYIFVLNCNV